MTLLLAQLLGAVLGAAQGPRQVPANRTWSGEVIDSKGKAMADARVVFYAPPVAYLKGDQVEVQDRTNSDGKFSRAVPHLERAVYNGIVVLAYSPGQAIGAVYVIRPRRVVLRVPRPRTLKVEGPDGQPIAGTRVTLRHFHAFGGTLAAVPESLAESLATSTGPDGTTTIGYLAVRDQLAAVRITADSIGGKRNF